MPLDTTGLALIGPRVVTTIHCVAAAKVFCIFDAHALVDAPVPIGLTGTPSMA